jgi:GNAT superfamily N-acetyltransferase
MGIEIRDAYQSDAAELSGLVRQLMFGEPSTAEQMSARLARLGASSVDRVLVAVESGRVVGLASLHFAWLVHADRPTARLMSLVVDEGCRGRGIGRKLVERACELAREWGCDRMELTSRLARAEAHQFYEATGFEYTAKRFLKKL